LDYIEHIEYHEQNPVVMILLLPRVTPDSGTERAEQVQKRIDKVSSIEASSCLISFTPLDVNEMETTTDGDSLDRCMVH